MDTDLLYWTNVPFSLLQEPHIKKISKISEQRISQAKYIKNKRVITIDKKKIIFSKKEAKKKNDKKHKNKPQKNNISSIFSLHSELYFLCKKSFFHCCVYFHSYSFWFFFIICSVCPFLPFLYFFLIFVLFAFTFLFTYYFTFVIIIFIHLSFTTFNTSIPHPPFLSTTADSLFLWKSYFDVSF